MPLSLPPLPPMDVNFNVSSNSNGLNPWGDETIDFGILGNHVRTANMNHALVSHNGADCVFVDHTEHDPSLIDSVLISSNHTNNGNLLSHVKQEPKTATSVFPSPNPSSCSSSPSFSPYQNSSWASPPPGFTHQLGLGQRLAQQTRRNILSLSSPRVRVESVIDYFPIQNRSHLACVSVRETVTKQYLATLPTSSMISVQNDIERVKRALACESTLWNSPSNHTSLSRNVVGDQNIDHDHANHDEILKPQPLNFIFPHDVDQNPYPWHQTGNLNNFSSYKNPVLHESLSLSASPNRHNNQNNGQDRQSQQHNPVKRTRKPKRSLENMMEYLFNESDEGRESEDDDYDGRTHSLPYEKYGPYTCPRCNNMFDTSQKFAAHMVSVHYKNETSEEKRRRLRAKYRKRFRISNPENLGLKIDFLERVETKTELQKIGSRAEEEEEEEAGVTAEGGRTSDSASASPGDDCLIDVAVKQESI